MAGGAFLAAARRAAGPLTAGAGSFLPPAACGLRLPAPAPSPGAPVRLLGAFPLFRVRPILCPLMGLFSLFRVPSIPPGGAVWAAPCAAYSRRPRCVRRQNRAAARTAPTSPTKRAGGGTKKRGIRVNFGRSERISAPVREISPATIQTRCSGKKKGVKKEKKGGQKRKKRGSKKFDF